LLVEFVLLCVALPTVIIVYRLAPFMFAFLWSAALYGALVMYRQAGGREFLRRMWRFDQVNAANLKIILPRWILACVGMTLVIYFYDPGRMFGLADRLPLWAVPLLVLAYTFFSALPQEFIFCAFFFRRYSAFFTTAARMVVASAIVFAYAHVLFINWVAPVLSFIAGVIFARTYQRTGSLALVTIEHGLYGGWLFIVGLGWYFYGGAVGAQ
jgi:membrane protease YdiL (CAAX protease family)